MPADMRLLDYSRAQGSGCPLCVHALPVPTRRNGRRPRTASAQRTTQPFCLVVTDPPGPSLSEKLMQIRAPLVCLLRLGKLASPVAARNQISCCADLRWTCEGPFADLTALRSRALRSRQEKSSSHAQALQKIPPRGTRANAHAERFVLTVRRNVYDRGGAVEHPRPGHIGHWSRRNLPDSARRPPSTALTTCSCMFLYLTPKHTTFSTIMPTFCQ
jgi:hypothetical protein